jgi:hypothetical protein
MDRRRSTFSRFVNAKAHSVMAACKPDLQVLQRSGPLCRLLRPEAVAALRDDNPEVDGLMAFPATEIKTIGDSPAVDSRSGFREPQRPSPTEVRTPSPGTGRAAVRHPHSLHAAGLI